MCSDDKTILNIGLTSLVKKGVISKYKFITDNVIKTFNSNDFDVVKNALIIGGFDFFTNDSKLLIEIYS